MSKAQICDCVSDLEKKLTESIASKDISTQDAIELIGKMIASVLTKIYAKKEFQLDYADKLSVFVRYNIFKAASKRTPL